MKYLSHFFKQEHFSTMFPYICVCVRVRVHLLCTCVSFRSVIQYKEPRETQTDPASNGYVPTSFRPECHVGLWSLVECIMTRVWVHHSDERNWSHFDHIWYLPSSADMYHCLFWPFFFSKFISLPFSCYDLVLMSVPDFMALSTVFHSANYPDNSPLSHSVLLVLFLPNWSFQLYISLWKSPSALIKFFVVDWA